MPNMADLTIKKADGTTDVTYVALTPSGGDRIAAQWRVEAIGAVAGNRPVFTISAKSSADKQARIIEGKLSYPETFTDSTTGIVSTRLRETYAFTAIVRQDAADATTAEFAAHAANLVKHTLIQSVIKTGYAPT